MTMIDTDKLKPALEAWRKAGAAVAKAVEDALDAESRGAQVQADLLGKQTQYLAGDREGGRGNLQYGFNLTKQL